MVCTGYPSDNHHPGYFPDLWQQLSHWGIRDQVIYLGLIPHEHVLLLMRQSICVINPSLFEGWGITVDEAISLGKQVLISNIPPHKEQHPPKATYFNPWNVEELENKLEELWEGTDPGPDLELEKYAKEQISKRLLQYAESFVAIVKEAAG